MALRYKGDFAGFSLAAGIGYGEITDGNQTQTTAGSRQLIDAQQFGGSISILHTETGLYFNAAAGQKEDDGLADVQFYITNPDLLDDTTRSGLSRQVSKEVVSAREDHRLWPSL